MSRLSFNNGRYIFEYGAFLFSTPIIQAFLIDTVLLSVGNVSAWVSQFLIFCDVHPIAIQAVSLWYVIVKVNFWFLPVFYMLPLHRIHWIFSRRVPTISHWVTFKRPFLNFNMACINGHCSSTAIIFITGSITITFFRIIFHSAFLSSFLDLDFNKTFDESFFGLSVGNRATSIGL